ncbi:DUF1767 domain-containing protein, partial [Cephalotus follicularis]
MLRRRLRLSYSSDEEDQMENQHQSLTHQNPTHSLPVTVPISDDDFIEVSDTLTPPSPPENLADTLIGEFLGRVGLRLKREWLDSCVEGLQRSVPGFSAFDSETKAKLCFEQFLFSDMNYSGAGVLPQNVDSMHLVDLKGPFVLQVDEIVNISCPLRGRYQDAPSGIKRCLKLSMTDGIQRVFGMEYRPIKDLKVLAPAGLKVAICNVHIRHGLLMLVPEAFEVLEGMVEELEAARQRLVNELAKPPRGKRTRTAAVPSLATRATLAAWPVNGIDVQEQSNNSTLQDTTPFHADEQGCTDYIVKSQRFFHLCAAAAAFVTPHTCNSQRIMEESVTSIYQEDAVPDPSSNVVPEVQEMHIDSVPISRTNAVPNPSSYAVSDVQEMHVDTDLISRTNAVANLNFESVSSFKDIQMVDEVEHLHILSGDREIPFTYMASLSAKWAAMKEKAPSVLGKIKCFLTGVKGFRYKQRATYELRVYVDDGSLISEILIDHHVVHKGIGHSPEEVTAALASSDIKVVSNMKEALRQFQIFLVNFEGTVLVEMNQTSHLPVALEMSQGCPASDAWLLLRRLKSSAPAQTPQHPRFDPIEISP